MPTNTPEHLDAIDRFCEVLGRAMAASNIELQAFPMRRGADEQGWMLGHVLDGYLMNRYDETMVPVNDSPLLDEAVHALIAPLKGYRFSAMPRHIDGSEYRTVRGLILRFCESPLGLHAHALCSDGPRLT